MDDMWSTKVWDDMRHTFPDDSNGSRIILTTRLSDVASYPDNSGCPHEMQLRDEDQSWDLLRAKVFKNQDNHHYPPELLNIGKRISGSCGGLPLAIVVIAGLLSTVSRDPASRREIAENVTSVVAAKDGHFEEILSLSYTHLPHHLRACFLYMGGFQEDYEIRVSFLVRLWIAEGFLKPQKGCKSLEDCAEDCLEDLVQRSLVMVSKRKSNGKIKSCRLHDLMRDLCIRKADQEKFLASVDPCLGRGNTHRRVSIDLSNLKPLPKGYSSTIRTIMCFHSSFQIRGLQSFRLLKVLIAGEAYVESLPAELFELHRLRLLAMVYLRRIPAAIAKLQNLQTLIILERSKEMRFSTRLPQEIWEMPELRHVIHCGRLPDPDMGESCSILENLQTLSSLASFMCSERILKRIPNVKKLKIHCYHLGAYLHNLVNLHQLESLELHAAPEYRVWRNEDSFSLPWKLKKLTLSGLRLPWSKMTSVGSLPNLRVLKLMHVACEGEIWETVEGEFPLLEYLLIEESNLEVLATESSHFPRLKSLLLHHCWQLSEIPDEIGEISTLEFVQVKGHQKKSLVESARRIKEMQHSYGNDALQLHCSGFRKHFWWKQKICF